MVLVRAGAALYVTVTVLATLIMSLLYFSLVWPSGPSSDRFVMISFAQAISLVTLPTSVLLVAAAWRGRRRPVLDGTLLIIAVAGVCAGIYLATIYFSPMGQGYEIFAGLYYAAGLVTIIPAYLITYFALRRTPLLRGLAPLPRTNGATEAGP